MEASAIGAVMVLLVAVLILGFIFYMVPVGLWLSALFAGVRVSYARSSPRIRVRRYCPGRP